MSKLRVDLDMKISMPSCGRFKIGRMYRLRQAGISQKTSARFFEILEDTLIVNPIPAYAVNETRRLVRHPRFYFFNNGVLNGLLKNFTLCEDRSGFLFEHFIVNQVLTAHLPMGEPARLSTYRTEAGSEICAELHDLPMTFVL